MTNYSPFKHSKFHPQAQFTQSIQLGQSLNPNCLKLEDLRASTDKIRQKSNPKKRFKDSLKNTMRSSHCDVEQETHDTSKKEYSAFPNLPNDVFELKSWIIDLRKEMIMCKDYIVQCHSQILEQEQKIEELQSTNDDLLKKEADWNESQKITQIQLENHLFQVNQKNFETVKQEQNLQLEVQSLHNKLKLEQENKQKTNLIQIEQASKIQDLQSQLTLRQSDILKLTSQISLIQTPVPQPGPNLQYLLDQSIIKEKELRYKLLSQQQEIDNSKKQLIELQEKKNQVNCQLEYQTNNNLHLQRIISDLNMKIDSINESLISSQGNFLEKNQKEKNLMMSIERYQNEIQQLKLLNKKMENDLENAKTQNQTLFQQIITSSREQQYFNYTNMYQSQQGFQPVEKTPPPDECKTLKVSKTTKDFKSVEKEQRPGQQQTIYKTSQDHDIFGNKSAKNLTQNEEPTQDNCRDLSELQDEQKRLRIEIDKIENCKQKNGGNIRKKIELEQELEQVEKQMKKTKAMNYII